MKGADMIRRSVLLGVLLFFLAGCETKDQIPPIKLNDRLALHNKKLYKASEAFYKTYSGLSTGQNASAANVRSAYNGIKTALDDVQKDVDKIAGTKAAGDDYIEAYKVFLQSQNNLWQQELIQIVQAVEAPGKTNAAKWQTIQGIIARIEKAETADLDKLKAAQKTFADASGFQLPAPPAPATPPPGGGPPRP
jgi:hypothetical protein